MKATLFLSSIFFLLGLKISNLIDLPGKAQAVDQLISIRIINSKPVRSLPIFNETTQDNESGIKNQEENDSIKGDTALQEPKDQ